MFTFRQTIDVKKDLKTPRQYVEMYSFTKHVSTVFLWSIGGLFGGVILGTSTNLYYRTYNMDLSRTAIYDIMFITTSICFLRGVTGIGCIENIFSVL
jgi:hypothetical protein